MKGHDGPLGLDYFGAQSIPVLKKGKTVAGV
jgi:hypothetical protein